MKQSKLLSKNRASLQTRNTLIIAMELPVDEVAAASLVPGALQNISKGKRNKRSSGIASDEEEDRRSYDSVVTEEEQDLANCLILLARAEVVVGAKRRIADVMGGCYECKTCSKTFPSFQALGGHRAGHGKPKSHIDDCDFAPSSSSNCSVSPQPPTPPTTAANRNDVVVAKSSTRPSKAHRCSVCGSEFSSGQALGGHMRRHRAVPVPSRSPSAGPSSMGSGGASSLEAKTRSFLSLDLNLPAPEVGEISQCQQNAAFHQLETHAFSTHALLGCHY
uniref:C2H2-type domain-containing protein n=1 Tax=Kalanchoe fedtschenkoi TaxID=63787 RepID=A0A7N0UA23_KALFE